MTMGLCVGSARGEEMHSVAASLVPMPCLTTDTLCCFVVVAAVCKVVWWGLFHSIC